MWRVSWLNMDGTKESTFLYQYYDVERLRKTLTNTRNVESVQVDKVKEDSFPLDTLFKLIGGIAVILTVYGISAYFVIWSLVTVTNGLFGSSL
jgi:hypothetical protein